MTLNPIEMLIVGGAFALARVNPVEITTPLWQNPLGWAALDVVHAGAKKLGFRYTPGILRDDWDDDGGNGFYEKQSAVRLFAMYQPIKKEKRATR